MDKKTVLKRTASVVAFALILLLVLNKAYDIVSWKDTLGNYMSTTKELYSTPKDTMEVVFVGSSHMYGGFDPNYLWTEYGVPAFNMTCSGQDKDSAVHQLKELLKTQSPKVVLVETYALLFDKQENVGNAYRNMLSMKFSKNANDLIKDYVEEEEQEDYLLRWPIVHTRYRELTKYDFVQYEPSIYGRGFTHSFYSEPIGLDWNTIYLDVVEEISEKNKAWIDELYDLSQEKGFELLFVQIPSDVSAEQKVVMNGCEQYMQELGITYLDLNPRIPEIGIDVETDFIDYNHINYGGAQKVSDYLSSYLLENYDVDSHDGEEDYKIWDKNANYSFHRTWVDTLGRTERDEYLDMITSQKDIITVISLDGWYRINETDWETILAPYGLIGEGEELDDYGTWIFRNGELIARLSNDLDEPIWGMDINDTDTLVIKNVDVNGIVRTTININDEIKCQNTNGLNVFVYDEITREVANTRHYD